MNETKMHNDPIAIVGAARTPIGGLQGDFATLSANDLGGVAIKARSSCGVSARRDKVSWDVSFRPVRPARARACFDEGGTAAARAARQ